MSPTSNSPVADIDNCPCTGATLEKLIQPAILTVLAQEALHGYRIAERIGEMPMFRGQKPDGSGVYRFLKGMEAKGFVVSTWDTSDSGPAKKLYELTAAGEECLSRWVETLDEYRRRIGGLLTMARKASAKRSDTTSRSCCTSGKAKSKKGSLS